eukprot:TRINITY_DN21398_c0_g5_i1.p1 TRINITY_DN21398_c0_g5~~TRINITY_DN21398_c0_g5_i1.p1  ORF type:complete len:469 (+),score=90.57 TRINITY_DN21398_c0_g5_i1:112-1518(+)
MQSPPSPDAACAKQGILKQPLAKPAVPRAVTPSTVASTPAPPPSPPPRPPSVASRSSHGTVRGSAIRGSTCRAPNRTSAANRGSPRDSTCLDGSKEESRTVVHFDRKSDSVRNTDSHRPSLDHTLERRRETQHIDWSQISMLVQSHQIGQRPGLAVRRMRQKLEGALKAVAKAARPGETIGGASASAPGKANGAANGSGLDSGLGECAASAPLSGIDRLAATALERRALAGDDRGGPCIGAAAVDRVAASPERGGNGAGALASLRLRQRWTRKGETFTACAAPVERCRCCTADAVASACDAFWELDVSNTGLITRADHVRHLQHSERSVKKLRWFRRANLELYFRRSTKPLCLEEYLRLIWSTCTAEDLRHMLRWAELRQAYKVLVAPGFRGAEADLKKLYSLLQDKSEGRILLLDIVRANILGREQVLKSAKTSDIHARIEMEGLKKDIWPVLKETFVVGDATHAHQ